MGSLTRFAVVVDLPLATTVIQNVFGTSETPVFYFLDAGLDFWFLNLIVVLILIVAGIAEGPEPRGIRITIRIKIRNEF